MIYSRSSASTPAPLGFRLARAILFSVTVLVCLSMIVARPSVTEVGKVLLGLAVLWLPYVVTKGTDRWFRWRTRKLILRSSNQGDLP